MKIKLTGALLVICLLALTPTAPGASTRRPITESDLLKLRWIADTQISPDSRRIAYVLVTVNEREDGYDTSLWVVAAAEGAVPRALTSGPRDSAPRWSPDSGTLAFLRAAEKAPRAAARRTARSSEIRSSTTSRETTTGT